MALHEATISILVQLQRECAPFSSVVPRLFASDPRTAKNITLGGNVDYDPFNRYTPFRVEARLDAAVLAAYVERMTSGQGSSSSSSSSSLATANVFVAPHAQALAPRSTQPPPTLSAIPSISSRITTIQTPSTSKQLVQHAPTSLLAPIPGNPPHTHLPIAHIATKHLMVPDVQQWRSVTRGQSPILVNSAVVHSPAVRPHVGTREAPGVMDRVQSPQAILTVRTPESGQAQPSFADALPSAAHPAHPPPSGFTLEGTIELFGIKALTAQFSSWTGTIPSGVTPPKSGKAIYDKAVIAGKFSLSTVLPVLIGTPFDDIVLQNVTFMNQNARFDSTKALGWHVDADLVIGPSCGKLYDILHTVLKIDQPTLHVHAGLGTQQSWSKPLALAGFVLDGTFPGLQVQICQGLTMTSVGAQLMGIRRMELLPNPQIVYDYGVGVFGSFNIDVPGSTTPVELDYQISELGGFVQLAANFKDDVWNNAFGVTGLSVSAERLSFVLA